jgi:trans-aconitate 2-methyltransferase
MAYEFDAGKYRRASDHQQTWGERLISELHLTGSERVLDLGCGEGRLTAMLARQTPHGYVLGIDASQNMIDLARHSHAGDNLEFRLMDINDMDFQGEFDVIFSNATLHWVKDHGRMLTRVHRALRPCGFIRFSFAGQGNCASFFEVVRRTLEEEPFATCFRGFQWPWFMPSTGEYEGLVAASEFAEARVWQENADTVFQTAAALTGWIDQPSLVPFLACLQGPDKRRFRDVVVGRMLERTRQADGTYLEAFRRINVRAVKSPGGNT